MRDIKIADMLKPTIITAQQYGTKVSVEIDHSDTDIDELFDAFQTLIVGLGYHESIWKQWILDRADEYREDENEYLKEKLNDWKEDPDEWDEQIEQMGVPGFDWNNYDHKIGSDGDEIEISERDGNILSDEIENPSEPNEALMKAAEEFNKAIREFNQK